MIQKTYLEIFWPTQMQMQAPITEMAKEEKLPEAWMPSRPNKNSPTKLPSTPIRMLRPREVSVPIKRPARYPASAPTSTPTKREANMVGLPEARLPLADAVILVATSPKSNSAHDAINAAIADVQAGRTGPIPRQLQNKHFDGEDALVKGQNYKYAHSYANHWVQQQYLPDVLKDTKYYTFGDNKTEQAARAYWAKIKGDENV